MKKFMFLLSLLVFSSISFANVYETWIDDFDQLVQKYVKQGTVDGITTNLIDYKGLRRDTAAFEKLAYLGKVDPNDRTRKMFAALGEKGELAFWINYYNYVALKAIVDNPGLKSITDLDKPKNPFVKQSLAAFHRKGITLDHIENTVVRKKFKEPLLCFALCNTTISGASLRNEAYRGEKLDEQLKNQLETFTSSSVGLIVDNRQKTLQMSQLFDWNKADFGEEPTIFLFKNKVIPAKALEFKVETLNYNWSLNCPSGNN